MAGRHRHETLPTGIIDRHHQETSPDRIADLAAAGLFAKTGKAGGPLKRTADTAFLASRPPRRI
jgi:hypothetical protein